MPASDAVLKEMLRLLGMKRVPTAKIPQIDAYAQAANIQPDKAVAALRNYNTHPDTAAMLADPNVVYKQGAINYEDPLVREILQRGHEEAPFINPQHRGWFRNSVIYDWTMPRVPMSNSYNLSIPLVQYQGAVTPLDYIDDALRDLTKKPDKNGWYTGIWTGRPYDRAYNYTGATRWGNKNGQVNSLYVRMEKPFLLEANGELSWDDLGDAWVYKGSLPRDYLPNLKQINQQEAKIRKMPGYAEFQKHQEAQQAFYAAQDHAHIMGVDMDPSSNEMKEVYRLYDLVNFYAINETPEVAAVRHAMENLNWQKSLINEDPYIPLRQLDKYKKLGLTQPSTNDISRFVKNDPRSKFDGMINYNIYDGAASDGTEILAHNVVPNFNTQVKRVDNYLMNPFDQNWSKAAIGTVGAGTLAGAMFAPSDAQANIPAWTPPVEQGLESPIIDPTSLVGGIGAGLLKPITGGPVANTLGEVIFAPVFDTVGNYLASGVAPDAEDDYYIGD